MKFRKEEFTTLNEMARVGNFNDYEVYVMTNDLGKIPHFHIRDNVTQGQVFHTCIRLDKAAYFHHNGKEDILNSKERKELVIFLTSKYRRHNITNWEHLLELWNDNNSDVSIDETELMPDYRNM